MSSLVETLRARARALLYYLARLPSHRASPAELFRRRGYYLSVFKPRAVPPHYLSFLPDGFAISTLGDTGLRIVDNFCTSAEAQAVIDAARERLVPRGVAVNNRHVLNSSRTSETAVVYDRQHQEPCVLPFIYRGAMLTGLAPDHLEAVYVTHYASGQKFDAHTDFFPGYYGDRLYTILIYLNDLEPDQGGETVFEELGISVSPRCGRAVAWTNKNPDGSTHPETRHAALPVTDGSGKWVIQLWFRRYALVPQRKDFPVPTPQSRPGKAVSSATPLPEGVRHCDGNGEQA